ncbi:cellulose binding domain-containing protein [Microbispora bryophytorum]|uniref:Cellulose binding domain-containing protein n=1 Tax=Microbispora bryophytorum subsp. camponoti TaxID=1677852 RepID=A0ABR8L123_9ACTN|nr:cellulose binding domain-containing protein [Microbispora camponoti]MBD3144667.1 cellulose binding domain-containing protein [Microbispora camponoti]
MIRRTIATAALAVAAAGITAAPAAPAAADSLGCTATYTITTVWGGSQSHGALAQVTVLNSGSSAIKGWRVSLRYSDGTVVTQVGGAVPLPVIGLPGFYAFGNESYNGDIPMGGSTTFGLMTSGGGGGIAPSVTCTPV